MRLVHIKPIFNIKLNCMYFIIQKYSDLVEYILFYSSVNIDPTRINSAQEEVTEEIREK